MRGKQRRAKVKAYQVPPSRWSRTLAIEALALALLTALAYGNSLGGSFHFDDHEMLKDPYVTGPDFGWEIFRPEQTRPLTYLTFHWNHLAGGANPWGYHAVNVLLHAGNSILVLIVAQPLLSPPAALFAASLFAVHPLQSESVNYIFQRATLLATLFALLSIWLFMQQRFAWSVAAFALSLLAKEETMALPAFLLLYDLAIRKKRPIRLAYYMALFLLTALAAARLSYALHVVPQPTIGFNLGSVSMLSYPLTQARVVWKYLGLFIVPMGLNLDHDVRLSQSLFSPLSTLPALLGLAAALGTLGWLTWLRKPPALWALGFFLLLAPSSSVIPAADVMFEHRTYFPLTCLVIAAAWAWGRLPRRAATCIGVALLMAFLAGTFVRNRVWRDEESLWTDVVEKSPRKVRPYLNLSLLYSRTQPTRARQLLERALLVDPNNADVHSHLGALMNVQNEPGPALQQFQLAMKLRGESAAEWNNIGTAHSSLGQMEEAVKDYNRALALEPCLQAPRLNLTSALASMGKRTEALTAGQIPPGCRFTPEDARELEDYRRTL